MAISAKDMLAAANAAVPKISVDEAKALIAKGALVVDVRDGTEEIGRASCRERVSLVV